MIWGPSSHPPASILLLTTALLGATCPGCFKATFEDASRPPAGEEHSEYESFFLIGLVGESDVDIRDHCESGRASGVQTGGNVGTTLISVLTVGIYTPRMVYVRCAPAEGKR